jgi:hypothetical protein
MLTIYPYKHTSNEIPHHTRQVCLLCPSFVRASCRSRVPSTRSKRASTRLDSTRLDRYRRETPFPPTPGALVRVLRRTTDKKQTTRVARREEVRFLSTEDARITHRPTHCPGDAPRDTERAIARGRESSSYTYLVRRCTNRRRRHRRHRRRHRHRRYPKKNEV